MPDSRLIRYGYRSGEVARDVVGRLAGEPIGISGARWPRLHGSPMHHVLTVPRAAIVAPLPAKVSAVAVFLRDPDLNEANVPTTEESAVLLLTEAELARGTTRARDVLGDDLLEVGLQPGALVIDEAPYAFEQVRARAVEGAEASLDPDGISRELAPYFTERLRAGFGGEPAWGASATHAVFRGPPSVPPGQTLLFWLYEQLVPGLNCGDGFLYVTASPDGLRRAAWWQS